MNFREEFRWKKLGFTQTVPIERFFSFHWRLPGLAYLIYRIIVAVYCLTWVIYTAMPDSNNTLPWGVFLTSWTYTLETTYFVLHAVFAIYFYFCSSHQNALSLTARLTIENQNSLFPEISGNQIDRGAYEHIPADAEDNRYSDTTESSHRPPWYAIILWILLSCASAGAIMVSIVFWAVLVPYNSDLGKLSLGNLQLHLINSILLLIEQSLTAFPARVLHVVYPLSYGMIYVLFSVFYWIDDHNHVIYEILDWNKPGPTMGYVLAIGAVVIPILHLAMYSIYRIKLKIFKSFCGIIY